MTPSDARASEILLQGIHDRAFPGATTEVGRADGPIWRRAIGTLTYERDSPAVRHDTIFDLASLTKVIATTTLTMRAVDDGLLALDEPVARHIPEWRGNDREAVTIRDLLSHASGLPAYLPFFRDHTGRVEFEPAIAHTPLEYRRDRNRSTATSDSCFSVSSSRMCVEPQTYRVAASIPRRR